MPPIRHRVSLGGQAVETSLAAVGFNTSNPQVALVETASPRFRYDTVLVQNAWNVIPSDEFKAGMRPYPRGFEFRARIRRAVAHWNLRRARRVVCLTYAVADYLRSNLGLEAVVAPATIPLGSEARSDWPRYDHNQGFALVSGTVTWYKNPSEALKWLKLNEPQISRVVFAGKDDGSGCWQSIRQKATSMDLLVERGVFSRSELYSAYAEAEVTILPSELESLGFGLSEALRYSPRVIASPIPAHLEVAGRAGVSPEWLGDWNQAVERPHWEPSPIDDGAARREWVAVGNALSLSIK